MCCLHSRELLYIRSEYCGHNLFVFLDETSASLNRLFTSDFPFTGLWVFLYLQATVAHYYEGKRNRYYQYWYDYSGDSSTTGSTTSLATLVAIRVAVIAIIETAAVVVIVIIVVIVV